MSKEALPVVYEGTTFDLTVTDFDVPQLGGNFEEFKNNLSQFEKYKNFHLTTSNAKEFKDIKDTLRALRQLLEYKKEVYVTHKFQSLKTVYSKPFDNLLDTVTGIEDALKEEEAVFDRERQEGVKVALDAAFSSYQDEFKLPEDYLKRVVYPKKYFNKSQKFEDSAMHLRQQFLELHKKCLEDKEVVEVIKQTCGNLAPEPYIKAYELGQSLTSVISSIQAAQKLVEDAIKAHDAEKKEAKKDSVRIILDCKQKDLQKLIDFCKNNDIIVVSCPDKGQAK